MRSSASTKLFQRLFATDCKRNERKSRCKTPRNDLPEDRSREELQTGPLPDPYRNGTPGSAHEAPFYTWLGPGIVSGRCHGLPSEARRGTRDRSKQRCTARTGGPNALGFQAAWCFALRSPKAISMPKLFISSLLNGYRYGSTTRHCFYLRVQTRVLTTMR